MGPCPAARQRDASSELQAGGFISRAPSGGRLAAFPPAPSGSGPAPPAQPAAPAAARAGRCRPLQGQGRCRPCPQRCCQSPARLFSWAGGTPPRRWEPCCLLPPWPQQPVPPTRQRGLPQKCHRLPRPFQDRSVPHRRQTLLPLLHPCLSSFHL